LDQVDQDIIPDMNQKTIRIFETFIDEKIWSKFLKVVTYFDFISNVDDKVLIDAAFRKILFEKDPFLIKSLNNIQQWKEHWTSSNPLVVIIVNIAYMLLILPADKTSCEMFALRDLLFN
jgi:hypothetical protein